MTGKRIGYPRITFSLWWGLRTEMQKVPDVTVTPDNVAFLLNISSSTAQTIVIPPLLQTGLITPNGVLTDLGKRWLDDDEYEYKSVCNEIISTVYPELKVSINYPLKNKQAVKRWFSAKTGSPSNIVQKLAATYLFFYRADLSEQNKKKTVTAVLDNVDGTGITEDEEIDITENNIGSNQTVGEERQNPVVPKNLEPLENETNGKHYKRNTKIAISININYEIVNETPAKQIYSLFESIGRNLL